MGASWKYFGFSIAMFDSTEGEHPRDSDKRFNSQERIFVLRGLRNSAPRSIAMNSDSVLWTLEFMHCSSHIYIYVLVAINYNPVFVPGPGQPQFFDLRRTGGNRTGRWIMEYTNNHYLIICNYVIRYLP